MGVRIDYFLEKHNLGKSYQNFQMNFQRILNEHGDSVMATRIGISTWYSSDQNFFPMLGIFPRNTIIPQVMTSGAHLGIISGN